jgi:hypothetical protein
MRFVPLRPLTVCGFALLDPKPARFTRAASQMSHTCHVCRDLRERLMRDAKSVQALRILSSADILHLQLSEPAAPQQGLHEATTRLRLQVKDLQARLAQSEAGSKCTDTDASADASAERRSAVGMVDASCQWVGEESDNAVIAQSSEASRASFLGVRSPVQQSVCWKMQKCLRFVAQACIT